jgi:hypothetical protein
VFSEFARQRDVFAGVPWTGTDGNLSSYLARSRYTEIAIRVPSPKIGTDIRDRNSLLYHIDVRILEVNGVRIKEVTARVLFCSS